LMGSVAEQVMRKATCPVLTVKMPFRRTCELTTVPTDRAAVAREGSSTANRLSPVDDLVELGVGD
jgi:hypothetical protein